MISKATIIGENVDYEDYSKQPDEAKRGDPRFIMSRSELTNFDSNPKRWLDGFREEEGDTEATQWGSLIDLLAMTPLKFIDRYAVAPAEYEDEKTGKMKPWTFAANVCKQWREEQGDKEILKAEIYGKAKLAVGALKADQDVLELFECSKKQVMVTAEWMDKVTGIIVPLRVLIDLVPREDHPRFGKFLCDFKTARNGHPGMWAKVIDSCGYDVQAALSSDIYVAATKEDRLDWVMPVQENVWPYHVVKPMPSLSAEFFAYGRIKYQRALTRYCQCLPTGKWPSYPTEDRLVIDACQLIGPESVWAYRQTAGQGRLSDFERRAPYHALNAAGPPEPEYADVPTP